MKRVLIITYYWPPSGGAGVQRVLKLVKYIREYGWEPVIYTAKDAAYPIFDKTLENDVPDGVKIWRNKIWEPYDVYKRFTGRKKHEPVYSGFISENKKLSLTQKLSIWVRGNFFIPDARCFWIKPSIRFLTDRLKKEPVDALFSTGPPHSTHMIAKGVKEKMHQPWLADFRDPWTQIDFYDQLMLTSWANKRHQKMEKSVLSLADKTATVSWHWADALHQLSGKQIEVVTNGFDEDDFRRSGWERDEKFSLCHAGFMNADRNHPALWEALKELCEEYPDFKNDLVIRLVGKNDYSVYEQISKNGLELHLHKIDYLPHNEISAIQQSAAVLLLPLNNTANVLGIIPGKLFEYLAAKRPILVIGAEDGDSARIINETGTGVVCGFNDKGKMKLNILRMYQLFKTGDLEVNPRGVAKYSRRMIAGKIAGLLDEMSQVAQTT